MRSVEEPQDVSCIQFIEVGSFFQWEMRWSSDDAFMTKFSEASNVCWVTVPRNPSVAGNQPCWPCAVSWTCQVWKCLGTVFLSLDSCCIPDALATITSIFLCLAIVFWSVVHHIFSLICFNIFGKKRPSKVYVLFSTPCGWWSCLLTLWSFWRPLGAACLILDIWECDVGF